jgi:hypothetical protein
MSNTIISEVFEIIGNEDLITSQNTIKSFSKQIL